MIPSITVVRMTGARHRSELPLLVLGPSLGTSAATLWTACAAGLTDAFDVVAWDLPGHGHNRGVPEEPFTMAELAAGVEHLRSHTALRVASQVIPLAGLDPRRLDPRLGAVDAERLSRSDAVIAGVAWSHMPVSQTSATSALSSSRFAATKAGRFGEPDSSSPSIIMVMPTGSAPATAFQARQASMKVIT